MEAPPTNVRCVCHRTFRTSQVTSLSNGGKCCNFALFTLCFIFNLFYVCTSASNPQFTHRPAKIHMIRRSKGLETNTSVSKTKDSADQVTFFPTRLTLLQKWNTHCQPNNKNQKLRENSVLIVFAICIQEIKTKPKSRMKLWLLCNGRVGNWAQNVCFSAARKYARNEIEERFKLWQIARNEKHKQLRLVKWKSRRGLGLCLVPA